MENRAKVSVDTSPLNRYCTAEDKGIANNLVKAAGIVTL